MEAEAVEDDGDEDDGDEDDGGGESPGTGEDKGACEIMRATVYTHSTDI